MERNIVLYHYVRDVEKTAFPSIHALPVKRFEEHLKWMQDKKDYLLTFDDGLKDHYNNALPLIKKYNMKAIFFIATNPIVKGGVLGCHKNHFLLAKLGTERMAAELNRFIKENGLNYAAVNDKERLYPQNRWDDNLTANLKYTINKMENNIKEYFLSELFKEHIDNERDFCEELYMSWDEIRDCSERGIIIGGHTCSHPMLSRINEEEQRKELLVSKKIIEDKIKKKVEYFSYPYGEFNKATLDLLKETGYAYAFTITPGQNDENTNPYLLKRMDATDLLK